MTMMFSRKVKELHRLLNTNDGERILAYLMADYVHKKIGCGASTNETMYHLGQKELVEDLFTVSNLSLEQLSRTIQTLTTDEDLL